MGEEEWLKSDQRIIVTINDWIPHRSYGFGYMDKKFAKIYPKFGPGKEQVRYFRFFRDFKI